MWLIMPIISDLRYAWHLTGKLKFYKVNATGNWKKAAAVRTCLFCRSGALQINSPWLVMWYIYFGFLFSNYCCFLSLTLTYLKLFKFVTSRFPQVFQLLPLQLEKELVNSSLVWEICFLETPRSESPNSFWKVEKVDNNLDAWLFFS